MKGQHVLVDYENVQPTIEDLLKQAPGLTDVWLFHGPNQIKRAEQLQATHERVTLVPHSGRGKNALDFHLSFYLGYVAARHPDASLLVVANDKGYDSMIEHAKLLGFAASRSEFKAKKAPASKKAAAPAKKAVAAKAAKPVAKKVTSPVGVAPAPVKEHAPSPTKKAAAKKQAPAKKAEAAPAPQEQATNAGQPAKVPPVKKVPAKPAVAQAAPAKKAPAKKAPAKKVAAKKSAAKAAPTKQATTTKAVASPADKVMTRATKALAKMGKNRPTKLSKLLRHLKSMVGQGATEADADALSRRLEAAKVIQVVGDLVLYP